MGRAVKGKAGAAAEALGAGAWQSLGAPAQEVQLRFTLPTGQSFRWRPTGPGEFTGVVGSRVFKLRQEADDIVYSVLARGDDAPATGDAVALRDYFNLDTRLAPLAAGWASTDRRFREVQPYIPGARVLRQDPVECAFEFICSSNNHISRIHGMVERLCRDFGTRLHATSALTGEGGEGGAAPGLEFFAFPTLEQLSAATEAHLRAQGFGYRAKFITGSVAQLLAKPEGGAAWLLGLRNVPYPDATEALCTLPGIGPKVAACVCLFALDKADAIPVDTHVWQLACRHYTPHLRNKTLTKTVMEAVQAAFVERFGPYAGWAHNTLFIAELASQQEHLPQHLRSGGSRKSPAKRKQQPAEGGAAEVAEAVLTEAEAAPRPAVAAKDEPAPPGTPDATFRGTARGIVADSLAAGSNVVSQVAADGQADAGGAAAIGLAASSQQSAAVKAEAGADAASAAAAAAGGGATAAPTKRRRRVGALQRDPVVGRDGEAANKAKQQGADGGLQTPEQRAAAPSAAGRFSRRLGGKSAVRYRLLADSDVSDVDASD